jgi:phosphoenolpyruvate carboxylase
MQINVKETINKILEQEGKQKGIQLIRTILKNINKKERSKQIRVNNYEEISKLVYELIFDRGYSRSRAIEQVANIQRISESTVNNHLTKFNREAREKDYMSIGAWVNECLKEEHFNHYIEDKISEWNVDKEIAMIYHKKFLKDIKKKENKNFERVLLESEQEIPF